MKKKFNVLKLAPPARDFEEAAELVKLADSEGVKFAVANPARYAPSFVAAHDVLQQGQLEHIYLIEAFCTIDDCDRPAWRSDPKLAGGGVLLHECYCLIDQILWNFPVPQQVYSLATNQTPDKQQRLYLTEDTAIVSMRFSDSLIGNLTAVQREGAGPKKRSLRVYGKDKILSATSQRFSLSIAEQIIEESACDDDQFTTLAKVLDNFGLSLLTPEQCVLTSTARENLKNMALIKSAYLSAMTGFPEEPLRILNMAAAQPQKP
jgi:predicted dehydrogenase